jgi:hypothetical protein
MLGVDSLTTGIQDAFEFDENGYVKVLAEGISLTTGDITLDMTTTDGKLDTVNTNLGTLEEYKDVIEILELNPEE